MGLLSTLGKIAGIAGPLIAAPFTGGTSLLGLLGASAPVAGAIGAGLGAAGTIAGGMSQGRATGRANEASLQSQLAERQNQTALDAARLKLSADSKRTGQLVGADLSQNWQPIQDPRMQKFGTPQGLSPDLLNQIRTRAQSALNTGSDVPAMQTPTVPQANGLDSLLNALSVGGSLAGALGTLKKPTPLTTMPTSPNSPFGHVNFPPGSMRF